MSDKPMPMPQVVVNFHALRIESTLKQAGKNVEDVREVVLGRNHIRFLFNKGQREGAVVMESRTPMDLFNVWSWCLEPTKKQRALGLDRVA